MTTKQNIVHIISNKSEWLFYFINIIKKQQYLININKTEK